MTEICPDILDEGRRLVALAGSRGDPVALLGGVAVRLRADEVPSVLDREYKDLDFATPKGQGKVATRLLEDSGYEPDQSFNAMNGRVRLLFYDTQNQRQVDVFVGVFRMCHEIRFADRLTPGQSTLPLAELMLTKLQIVELNEKDVRDTALLLLGHPVEDHDGEAINGRRIAALCASDWGLWRTITANIDRCGELLPGYALEEDARRLISDRLTRVRAYIDDEPKGRAWKLRAKIGDRKRWYELPDEVDE